MTSKGCVCDAEHVARYPSPNVAWAEPERERFRQTLKHAGHTEEQCAVVLSTEFGAELVTQATVSRWASGATKQPSCAAQLLAYCDTYGPARERGVVAESEGGEPPKRANDDRDGPHVVRAIPDEATDFSRLAGQAAGEPLLGPAQLELVRGMSRRLQNGPPLSPEDRATYLDQLRILGVPRHEG